MMPFLFLAILYQIFNILIDKLRNVFGEHILGINISLIDYLTNRSTSYIMEIQLLQKGSSSIGVGSAFLNSSRS